MSPLLSPLSYGPILHKSLKSNDLRSLFHAGLGVSKMFDTRQGVRCLSVIQVRLLAKAFKPTPETCRCPRPPPRNEGQASAQVCWKTRPREARETRSGLPSSSSHLSITGQVSLIRSHTLRTLSRQRAPGLSDGGRAGFRCKKESGDKSPHSKGAGCAFFVPVHNVGHRRDVGPGSRRGEIDQMQFDRLTVCRGPN